MAKLDLHIGVPVHAIDKTCGKLANVVIEPDTQQVSDLIVQYGLIMKEARVVPVAKVASATPFEIRLDLEHEEFKNFAKYREFVVKEPMPNEGGSNASWGLASGYGPGGASPVPTMRRRLREGVAAGKQILGRKTGVENTVHELGKVDHVILNQDTGQISEIVMRAGLFPHYHVIPGSSIEEIQEESILVSLADDELDSLPEYKPRADADILEDVMNALLSERTPAFHSVEPRVTGGVVRLTGNVASPSVRNHAEELARLMSGVIDVENDLVVGDAPSFTLASPAASPVASSTPETQDIRRAA
jgi:uncharacterized protein YrrD